MPGRNANREFKQVISGFTSILNAIFTRRAPVEVKQIQAGADTRTVLVVSVPVLAQLVPSVTR